MQEREGGLVQEREAGLVRVRVSLSSAYAREGGWAGEAEGRAVTEDERRCGGRFSWGWRSVLRGAYEQRAIKQAEPVVGTQKEGPRRLTHGGEAG